MADRSKHTSMFPELDMLYYSQGPCHILGNTILAQSILTDPAIIAHKNSSEQSSISSSSPVVTLKNQKNPCNSYPGTYGILSGLSQVISKSLVAPIERVSILMQCQNEMLKYGHLSSPYKGMKDCFLRTIKHEGVLSLWRGNSVNVFTILTIEASKVYHSSRRDRNKNKELQNPPFLPVALSVISAELFLYPLQYARIRLANDVKAVRQSHFSLDSSAKSSSNAVGNRMFSGVFDVYKKTLASEGIVGLYRGYTFACVGLTAYYQVSRGFQSHYKTQKQSKEQLTYSKWIEPVVSMGLPFVFFPFTAVCRRMMMTSGEATKYNGAVDAVLQIVKHEGASALYKGMAAHAIFILAKNASVFAFFYCTYSGLEQLIKRRAS